MRNLKQPALFAEPQLAMFEKSPEQIALEQRAAQDFTDYRDAGGTAYSCQQAWDEAV